MNELELNTQGADLVKNFSIWMKFSSVIVEPNPLHYTTKFYDCLRQERKNQHKQNIVTVVTVKMAFEVEQDY